MVGIYQITNAINGKSYVGQSIDVERRFIEHRNPHGKMTSIKLAIKKYGVGNFVFKILEECSVERLDEREVFWISNIKPEYNRSSGGSGCKDHKVSQDVRKTLSEKNKQYWMLLPDEKKLEVCSRLTGQPAGHSVKQSTREKLRQANIGKKQSYERIQKFRETMRIKKENGWVKDNSYRRKKIICIETGESFSSVKEAAAQLGLNPNGISAVLNNRQENTRGKHFSYVV